ncbi:enoyl-CoA hydratase [Phyllosticta capitalensis]|uniref:Enoyl-CoA hydratase n=1 Tax=Phyllosticta capitalensis TaxID=121624 RepID=A0ABR1Z0G0_9PEZI
MTTPKFTYPPPRTQYCLLSFPAPFVLLVTLNRPRDLNCINGAGHVELDAVWSWMDREPSLRVGIVTGAGRAFCAGADLKEWHQSNLDSTPKPSFIAGGFGGLSRRSGLKPVIAAVNGLAMGGGCEMIVNADLVYAAPRAVFALPEAKRGVIVLAGALPRLVRTVGRQRAMEMALTGRNVSAQEMMGWGVVNGVVGDGDGPETPVLERKVVKEALRVAGEIAANSPDSVIINREGVKIGWGGVGVEEGTRLWADMMGARTQDRVNMEEGVKAFVEKRKPVWRTPKL